MFWEEIQNMGYCPDYLSQWENVTALDWIVSSIFSSYLVLGSANENHNSVTFLGWQFIYRDCIETQQNHRLLFSVLRNSSRPGAATLIFPPNPWSWPHVALLFSRFSPPGIPNTSDDPSHRCRKILLPEIGEKIIRGFMVALCLICFFIIV